MPPGRRVADGRLIDLDAQAGRGEPLEAAVDEAQRLGVDDVVEHFGALVVVDADRLLLDEVVGRGERHLQTRRERDRAERAVRGDHRVVRLRHRRDPSHLGDAAGVRQVGLQDGDPGLQGGDELLPGVQPLPRRDRDAGGVDDPLDHVRVLGHDRLFEEEGMQRFEQRRESARRRDRESSVQVDRHVAVGAEHLAGAGDPGDDAIQLGGRAVAAHPPRRVHLHRGEAHGELVGDVIGDLVRVVAADPAVGADALTHRAAQQVVHGHAEALSLDVPQRLVDAGDGAGEHRAATVELALGEHLPVVFDAVGVLAGEVHGELLHRGRHDIRVALQRRLAPAHQPVVGLDAHEQPAGRDRQRLHPRDAAHAVSPTRAR
jgi:hypothetical protein